MEENKYSTSRVSLQVGEITEETTKSSINFKATFSKAAADSQAQKLGILSGLNPDPSLVDLSLVILFTPVPGKTQRLKELIEMLLSGEDTDLDIAADISELFDNKVLSYSFIETEDHLALRIKPGEAIEGVVSEFLQQYVVGGGLKDLASHEEATLEANISSGIDFYDLLELHKAGYTTLSAFFKSFQAELIGKAFKGSNFAKKIFDIVKSFLPFISETPLPLIQLLDTVDVDVAFRSIDEAPAAIKKSFGFFDFGELTLFPRAPKDVEAEEYELVRDLTGVLHPKIQVYATATGLAAAELSIKTPGFGVCALVKQE